MSTSSFDPAVQVKSAKRQPSSDGGSGLRARLADLLGRARDPHEFFQQLADEMQRIFDGSVIVIQSAEWSAPIIRGSEVELLDRMDQKVLLEFLDSAIPVPASLNVPLQAVSANQTARAMRVQFFDAPNRVAAVVIRPPNQRINVISQIEELKTLRCIADTTRRATELFQKLDAQTITLVDPPHREHLCNDLRQSRSLSRFHSSLDLNETCYRIANGSRQMLGCDRVALLVPKHSRFRVVSISGVSVIDRRSNLIRAMEDFANATIVLDSSIEFPTDESLPPQIQDSLNAYWDEAGVNGAKIIPLRASSTTSLDAPEDNEDLDHSRRTQGRSEIQGIMLIERFSGGNTVSDRYTGISRQRVGSVANEAALALRNALEHDSVFGLKIRKLIGQSFQTSRARIWSAVLLPIFLMITAGLLWPVEHRVVATGVMEPIARRDVFAAVDGAVARLHIQDGQRIEKGDLMVELENPELESRVESLAGQIQTTRGRLASLQSVRLGGKTDPAQSNRIALEESQLESDLENLIAQQQVLQLQTNDLRITSPIAGTVVAWQIDRRLMGRPINRGNQLCSVVDTDGAWRLRLNLPEKRSGALLNRVQEDQNLSVRFAVATMPEKTFQARLEQHSHAAQLDDFGNRVIELVAVVENDAFDDSAGHFDHQLLPVGVDVTAKIACGQRSIVHSWFSDAIDYVNRQILFRFR